MIPRDTVYRLATTGDLRRCHALMRVQGQTATLSWLTVIAERDGHLLGFLSTSLKKAVVAGPMFIDASAAKPGWVAMRLVEALENVLIAAGVTIYLFAVDKSNTPWRRTLEKVGIVPYQHGDTVDWYQRELPRRTAWAIPQ